MAIVYRKVGSLTNLLKKLDLEGISDFKNLEEIIKFRQEIKEIKLTVLKEKKLQLKIDINNQLNTLQKLHGAYKKDLKIQIPVILERIRFAYAWENWYSHQNWLKKIFYIIKHFELLLITKDSNRYYSKQMLFHFSQKTQKIIFIRSEINDKQLHGDIWVKKIAQKQLNRLDHIYNILKKHGNLIAGAVGENLAISKLEKLPKSYTLINDFTSKFYPPIYNRREEDKIFSVQIDHIVVGPTGLFIIETKNWSQKSIDNKNFFSPIKQLKRVNFAIFTLLNSPNSNHSLRSLDTNWGRQKISPKNCLLLISHKPHQEYQYIKILTLNEINRYITSGEIIFRQEQVKTVVRKLLSMSE